MLDFTRERQRRGPFPNVRRALLTYWAIERERQTVRTFRAAFHRMKDRPPVRSRGSIEYQYWKGREYDAELLSCWGSLYPTLVAETLGQSEHKL